VLEKTYKTCFVWVVFLSSFKQMVGRVRNIANAKKVSLVAHERSLDGYSETLHALHVYSCVSHLVLAGSETTPPWIGSDREERGRRDLADASFLPRFSCTR